MTATATRAMRKAASPALWLLAFMMSAGPFGDTEYTPAMPAMAHALHTGYGMVQFSMAAYLVASSVSQLFFGPISDRYGRRPVMLAGASILALGALLCMVSFSIWPLIGGRFIQGIGACVGAVIADACVRDAFPADKRQRIYAKINAAFALAPAVGPVAGTYVAHAFGWHANFALLLAVGLALTAAVWLWLPETLEDKDPHALEAKQLWRNAREVISTRGFLFYVALGGLCVGVVYTALIGAPDLVINMLGLGSRAIVVVAVVILVAFVIGAGSCALLSRKVPHLVIIGIGIGIVTAGSVSLLIIDLRVGGHGSLADYLAPIGVSFIGVGLTVPVTTAKAMAPFADNAGAASSLLGFLRMGVAALGTIAMSAMHKGSVYDMPTVFLALSAIGITVFISYLAIRGKPPEPKSA